MAGPRRDSSSRSSIKSRLRTCRCSLFPITDFFRVAASCLVFLELNSYVFTTPEKELEILSPRHAPSPDLGGHLTFTLKYEGVDLAVLKRLFKAAGPAEIEDLVRAKPTGRYARRIWFLYEWLTGTRLNLPDAGMGGYVPAIDPEQQWTVEGENSPLHHVVNNLPGTPVFWPLVFRTKRLEEFAAMDLANRARAAVANAPRDLLARTAVAAVIFVWPCSDQKVTPAPSAKYAPLR